MASMEAVEDVLGHGFVQESIELGSDREGPLRATLVHRSPAGDRRRAVLYLHGYNDYFFQVELADRLQAAGYDFYALDLRRYGRSYHEGQTPCFTESFAEYYAELDVAVRRIRERDGHDTLVLLGHSTGGLLAAIYAHDRRERRRIDAVVLDSAFLGIAGGWMEELLVEQIISRLGSLLPRVVVREEDSLAFAWSLHRDFGRGGEWEYDLEWKRPRSVPLLSGWLAAIRHAQLRVQEGLSIRCPVLSMFSAASGGGDFDESYFETDTVLDVGDIDRYSDRLGADVTKVRIEGGMHDLFLSRPAVRERAYVVMTDWLAEHFGSPP